MHILVKKSIDSSNDVKKMSYEFKRSAEIVKSEGFKKYYICPI